MGKLGKKSFWIVIAAVLGLIVFAVWRNANTSITAEDLKQQYECTEVYMVPLYNLSQNQKLVFDFAMDYSYAKKDEVREAELISVHTSPACNEESRVDCHEFAKEQNGNMRLTIFPTFPVLPTDEICELANKQNEDGIDAASEDFVSYWGMAPVYYICIRYDLESEELKELEKPYIIPFTVKSEVEVPKVTAGLDDEGNFFMSWDEIEGADKYIIYKYMTDADWLDTTNRDTHGSELGYAEGNFYKWEETTDTYYANIDEDDSYFNLIQNFTINGTYFVSAVSDGKESNLSEPIYTSDFRLPYLISLKGDLEYRYKNMTELPRAVCVTNKDGTVTRHSVIYQKIEQYEDETDYSYKVAGTCLSGTVFVGNGKNKEMPETISDNLYKDEISKLTELEKLPSMAVKSVLMNEEDAVITDTIYGQVKPVTEANLKRGNQMKIKISNPDYEIAADSAEEAWLSYHLMEGKKEISLLAFPKLQEPYILEDALLKVCTQNPYIFGVYSYGYDCKTATLKIEYNESVYSIHKKQAFVYEEGKKIISEIIKDNMTDEEKEKAIYNWIAKNVGYDKEAFSEIVEDGFKEDKEKNKDTQDSYSILKNGIGTCSAYADTFKLLADMAGLEVRTITGYLDGNILHAWNLIKLGNSWYQTDCSHNEATIGIPYFLYNAGEKQAARTGYNMTKEALLDQEYYKICPLNIREDMEYYKKAGLTADNIEELKSLMSRVLENDSELIFRYDDIYFSERDMINAIKRSFMMEGREDELANMTYLYLNGYFVIFKE